MGNPLDKKTSPTSGEKSGQNLQNQQEVAMTELSEEVAARSRKIQATILQRFAQMKNANVALRAGVHEGTISRFSNERLESVAIILAAAGLQVVSADAQVIDPQELRMLKGMAVKYLEADLAHYEISSWKQEYQNEE